MKNKDNLKIGIKMKMHEALKISTIIFKNSIKQVFLCLRKGWEEWSIFPTEEHLKKEDSCSYFPMLVGHLGRLHLEFYLVISLLEFCPKCFHQNLKIITVFK